MSFAEKTFTMKHVFTDVLNWKYKNEYNGKKERHFDFDWKIGVYYNEDGIYFGLDCLESHRTNNWSIETECEFRFISDTQEDFVIEKNLRNFDESMKMYSDVVLVVDNEKFYVSKLFLASQSTFFDSLFLGNFEESTQSEISLKDIDSYDFQCFLEVIHGELAIDDDTVDAILHLADMYDSKMAIQRCEQFIIEKSPKSLKEKLEMSAQYNLKYLKESCLAKIETLDDIRSVVPTDLEQMDHSVMAVILQKALSHNC